MQMQLVITLRRFRSPQVNGLAVAGDRDARANGNEYSILHDETNGESKFCEYIYYPLETAPDENSCCYVLLYHKQHDFNLCFVQLDAP